MTDQEYKARADAIIQKAQQGELEFYEVQRELRLLTAEYLAPQLQEYRQREQWDDYITMALSRYEVMPLAFRYYDEIPDSKKYQFAIDAYIHHGDSVPAVRKAVRNALKYGRPDLPPEIADQESITIYRAGEEPIEKARYRISWTIDKTVAEFFLNEYIHRHASHLYKGTIKTADIIAYCDDRKEKEVMQYNKVFNITEINAV